MLLYKQSSDCTWGLALAIPLIRLTATCRRSNISPRYILIPASKRDFFACAGGK